MRPHRILAAAAAAALLAAGCSGRDGPGTEEATTSAPPRGAAAASFGELAGVCGPGTPTSSPAQGVTASEIKVGVFSDVGFTKNQEFADSAKVFTSWCNDLGGINGRKVVADLHDTRLMEVRPRMIEACRDDFALVGGGAGLDSAGVRDRLSCLLPDFPAQTVQLENTGSDLQLAQAGSAAYAPYAGLYTWLLKEAHSDSARAVGVISGDTPITKVYSQITEETVKAVGGSVTYNDLYPAAGVADWTPYAQSLKSKGVKGLVFYGQYPQLAKLEQALTAIDYRLDWIDANSNAYTDDFLQLAGDQVLRTQNNVTDLGGVNPPENAAANQATRQLVDLYATNAPGAHLTFPALKSFSAWLLFAKAASSCGDNLTRTCVYKSAMQETAWTGGGLQAPVDLSRKDRPVACFNIEKATEQGWQPADFHPNNRAYRCDAPAVRLTGTYPKPVTLADVGKSMADLK
ncbi:MAG: ABC transporter substrate-binding protein [Streptomycetaceae bacterium]|nr:ABC transporter substrate-binding protein [Streptomycetaceae bacterium]